VPTGVRIDIFRMILKKHPPEQSILRQMKKRLPHLDEFVIAARGAVWISRVLEGEVTKESLQNRKEKLYAHLQSAKAPYKLVEAFLKPYQCRPQGPPAKRRTLYLLALDHKRWHREVTWGQLALRFCKDKAKENTLKASIMAMKKQLAQVGIDVDLTNPAYSSRSRASATR
jgi:hypothetical protein